MPKNRAGREIAEVIPDRCIGCQICVGACPVDAIRMENGIARIDVEKCTGCGRCFDVCPAASILFEKARRKKAAVAQGPRPASEFKGVAVFIETSKGRGAEVSWELAGKARELADKLGTTVVGLALGSGVEGAVQEAIEYGCDTVWMIDDPQLQTYTSHAYGEGLVQLCEEVKPEVVLLGATPLGRDLAGVVATRLETGLTADCTGLDIEPESRLLLMTRPTFGGNIMATICCRTHRPQMATVRPRVMKMPARTSGRKGEVKRLALELGEESPVRLLDFVPMAELGDADIAKAPVLVVIGKGACDSRHVPMFEELARLLGGTIACSRPVVEAGLLPYVRQVGQTGKTVAPRLYIGIAVSGAVQHLVAMQGAEKVIAINSDRNAPMARIADYALIGNYQDIVPALIEGIKTRLASVGSQA